MGEVELRGTEGDEGIPSPVDDIHFFADFPFPADVIAWTEEDRSESEDELAEKAGLSVLKDLHSLQCIQMHVNRDLGFQFVCRFN